jgi:hypothetical protein
MTEKQPDRLAEALAADTAPDDVPPPPADLVDRTLQAMAAQSNAEVNTPAANRAGRWRRVWPLVVGLAAGVALGGPAWVALRSRADGFSAGERRVDAQETIQLGQRAVLVAEAGADLRWQRGDGGVQVQQRAGEVFYRVNAGEFRVQTPAGVIRVMGTCFRVEVSDMKLINRQNLSGAAVGAALGAAVMVTVYEGRVLLASAGDPGAEVALTPGQVGQVTAGGAAERLSPGPDRTGSAPGLAHSSNIPRFDDRETLRTRIAEQEKELAHLRSVAPMAKKLGEGRKQVLNPSRDELLARVERCELAYDTPSINGVNEKEAQKLGLSDTEREAMNEALKETRDHVASELRRLYVEMGGDPGMADRLSPQAMETEIFARAPDGARPQARQQLARELAGLATTPTDLSKTPIAERATRLMSTIGNLFEQKLAERLGPQRARGLRAQEDGWRGKTVTNGCN